ncbi:hypothetical protein BDV93DRAFT_328155 [Ceratobasidium sp. AG-I]|nr:hypothetical protein BDV93DRAFT_328155 [Ceratobasidium sp. AG-I]
MPEDKKRDTSTKHSNNWVESSFTMESPSSPKKRRVDAHHNDEIKPKPKPKAPIWVASEFSVPQPSLGKASTRHPPPQPRDPNTTHVVAKAAPNPFGHSISDDKPRKQNPAGPFSAQPAPSFAVPKTPKNDVQHRAPDSEPSRIHTPAFRTNIPRAATIGTATPKDVIPMPPPPRIEAGQTPGPPSAAMDDDKEYTPLTDLITPRLFGIPHTVTGKGKARMVDSDEEMPISDDPFVDQPFTRSAVLTEAIEADAEAFAMRELARGLGVSPSKPGYSGASGRKGAIKFVKDGLAARALMLISQREKDDSLWHYHQTSKLNNKSAFGEDLRVQVAETLHPPGESVLARCRVTTADVNRARGVLSSNMTEPSITADAIFVDVLLSRPGGKDLVGVESGRTIRLWRPWIEVDLDAESRAIPSPLDGQRLDGRQPTHSVRGDDADNRKNDGYSSCCIPDEEKLGSYSKNLARDRPPRCALLCSRFIVG